MSEDISKWEKGSYSVSYGEPESTHTYTLRDSLYSSADIPKALNLLDQIIERAIKDDEAQKSFAISQGDGSKAVGESWTVFHLKALKILLEQ